MEIKLHALLLSLLVIAGATTVDAFAQTTAERLLVFAEETNTIVKAIQTAIAGIASGISDLATQITGVETAVEGVNDAVGGVNDSVTALGADIAEIKSSISGFDGVQLSLAEVDERLTTIESKIDILHETVSDAPADPGLSTAALLPLVEQISQINLNVLEMKQSIATINFQLLELQNKTIATPAPGTTPPGQLTFVDTETTKTVSNYDYKSRAMKTTSGGQDYYDLKMTFSCSQEVFIKSAVLTKAYTVPKDDQTPALPDGYLARDANAATAKDNNVEINYVMFDGRVLYQNDYPISSTQYLEFNREQPFLNQRLTAGNTLTFDTRIYDGLFNNVTGTDLGTYDGTATAPGSTLDWLIQAAEKNTKAAPNNEIALYNVEVKWNAYQPTSCSISFGSDVSAPNADTPKTLTYGASVPKTTAALETYSDTLDCGGAPLTITDITAASGESANLSDFGTIDVTILDGSESTPDVSYSFDKGTWDVVYKDTTVNELPLQVSGHDIKISGKLPVESLIVIVKYETLPDAECTILGS